MEDELDAIFTQYDFDDRLKELPNPTFSSFDLNPVPGSTTPVQTRTPTSTLLPATTTTAATSSSSHFAPLKTDSDVEQAKTSAVPQNMQIS